MNILVTSLSSFTSSPVDRFIHKSTYKDTDGNWLCEAYHSAVPVCEMLIDRLAAKGEKLDKILTVTTNLVETPSECTFVDDKNDNDFSIQTVSALDYFKSVISSYIKEKTAVDFSDFGSGAFNISSLTKSAATLADEIEKCTQGGNAPNVYIDATGGFRDNIIVIISIMHILSARGIYIKEIYGTEYNFARRCGIIVPKTDNYSFIYLVSGIDEFLKYGRASRLTAFFENADNRVKSILKIIENLATGIQLCNMDMFASNVRKLKKAIPDYLNYEAADPLFSYLLKRIETDYDVLLNSEKSENSVITVARWCVRKEFFQQALTFLESQLPKEFISKQIVGTAEELQELIELSENRRLLNMTDGTYAPNRSVKNSWKSKESFLIDESLGISELRRKITSGELHPACQNEKALRALEAYFLKIKIKRNEINHGDSDFSRIVFLDFMDRLFNSLEEAGL